ncbi:hypothetical protein BMW24_015520 [Mycobacterium heckeshornense]|uniref:hypothetical protein n=1 Tax=Mycobacterium heckeshornense TaxID=110505 RepID=UPI00066230FA|nr:hypothetical protein [Mycobacterium heckeshornense]KMV21042.1 hypothetical protein ACT16_18625 [Mycobacterium heckeshornense]PIJ33610.1 hypothetical protein BMW24_015520 [Mycobacterium heckeshornense]
MVGDRGGVAGLLAADHHRCDLPIIRMHPAVVAQRQRPARPLLQRMSSAAVDDVYIPRIGPEQDRFFGVWESKVAA